MGKTKVLVILVETFSRRTVVDMLSSDPSVEVVGAYATCQMGLLKIPRLAPDVVLVDARLPALDTQTFLRDLKKDWPTLPLILCGTPSETGFFGGFHAVSDAFCERVALPDANLSSAAALQAIRETLLRKVRSASEQKKAQPATPLPLVPPPFPPPLPLAPVRLPEAPENAPRAAAGRLDVLAIGISTGGPKALQEVIPRFPADLPVPVLVVQHMPLKFTRLLADSLNAAAQLTVLEAEDGMPVRDGFVYLAPGNYHMTVERNVSGTVVRTSQEPPENACRPAADVLFRSLPPVYGARILALVMTGMGQDGLKGCAAIRQSGGYIVTQNEASSTVWGMPGVVTKAGLADMCLPLTEIAFHVMNRLSNGRDWRPPRPA